MIYKKSERRREFLGLFYCSPSFLYFGGVFNKTIIPLALAGYEMILGVTCLVGYLSSHLQRALTE